MKLFSTVILILGSMSRLTEATFPGIFLLPFMSSPKLLHKVSPTHSPLSAPLIQPQATTKLPAQHQSDFVKLHNWLEQTQHLTYVSTNKNEKSQEQQAFQLLEGSQPQLHHIPGAETPIITASPSQNFSPSEAQVAALATNHGPPQRSPAYHQQHQPVPLTFPPTSSGSTDSYSLPRIISLPPLPPPHQPQQQLPQSSSHYTTSGLSYSFSQGTRQGYDGSPQTTKIVRHVSVFVAPPDLPYNSQNRQKIRVQKNSAEKIVNVIFIKSPDSGQSNIAVDLPPPPEQKTYVYVLNKAQEGPVVNTPEPPKYNPPEVFFLNYHKNQEAPQQQHEVPSQYGPSSQHQHVSSPPPQNQQQINPPHQNSQSFQQLPQQKQPSLEYVAPSNQKFNYTLPLPVSVPSSVEPNNVNAFTTYGKESDHNNSYTSLGGTHRSSVAKVSESNQNIRANRRIEEESYYHAHNLSYFNATSEQSHHGWESQQNQQYPLRLEYDYNRKHNQNEQKEMGLYSPLTEDNNMVNSMYTNINGSITKKEPAKHHQQQTTVQTKLSPSSAPPSVATKTGDAVSLSPNITARSFFPSSPSTTVKKYTPVADTDKVLTILHSKNASLGDSKITVNGDNTSKVVNNNINDSGEGSDIIVLTKRNLTTIASGDLVDDNVKKKDARIISGRPDYYSPYNYAPSMGHEYFGIARGKVSYKQTETQVVADSL